MTRIWGNEIHHLNCFFFFFALNTIIAHGSNNRPSVWKHSDEWSRRRWWWLTKWPRVPPLLNQWHGHGHSRFSVIKTSSRIPTSTSSMEPPTTVVVSTSVSAEPPTVITLTVMLRRQSAIPIVLPVAAALTGIGERRTRALSQGNRRGLRHGGLLRR